MSGLDPLQWGQAACAQQQNYGVGQAAGNQFHDGYYASLSALNAQTNVCSAPRPRFRSIDPTQKLSDTAARLLSLNHLLRDA